MIENDASCLFLAHFLHLTAEKKRILEPLSPLHVKILLPDLFGGVYSASQLYNYGSFLHNLPIASHVFHEQKNVCSLLTIK